MRKILAKTLVLIFVFGSPFAVRGQGAGDYIGEAIGNPALGGSASPVGNGYAVTGAGTNIYGTSDQFFFNYRETAGDFDLKVRIDSLASGESWAKAGLMARETLNANSRHAATFATPNVSGTFFAHRVSTGGATTNRGSFPVAYPNTWLRLQRTGNNFIGYAGVDGLNWVQLGSITLNAPTNVFYVGMAVTGASATEATTAQFRDQADATGESVANVQLPFEPLGPSSRNTGLVISEIMYHPKPSNGLEFIEIFNAGLIAEDLGGYRISGDVDYTFAPNTVLAPGEFLVVARDPAALQAASGISGVLGPWDGAATNALPDNQGTIRLRHRANAVLVEVNYEGIDPWPIAADGAGHSLVLARPSYGADNARAWVISERIGGSPGRLEAYNPDPLRSVVINEFLANSDVPLEDFIELYNHSTQPVDVSGAYLSDDRDTNKFRIPNDTIIPARGFVSFNQTTLGFGLGSEGERVYFVNPGQNRVIDAIAFGPQANGVSSGRYPDGASTFHELAARTAGESNAALLIRDIVINEIMYNPISRSDDDEYVELHNRGTNTVDVSNWRFVAGIDFRIPANTVIPPTGYLVIAKNAATLLAKYTHLNPTNTLGDYGGMLANGGERLALAMPEYFFVTNNNIVVTQANFIVVDEVSYVDAGRWSIWADGGGSSLELIDAHSDNRFAANWADSDETGKSEWFTLDHVELISHVYPVDASGAAHNEVQLMILGAGETLVDDIEVNAVAPSAGPNLVTNGTFTAGLASWLRQGNHVQSVLEPAGPNNPSDSLRLRASGGGDNGANRIEADLRATLSANTTARIAAKLRWLRGHRDVLMRLHGGGIEAVVTLPVPDNLGTPGLANSRRLSNSGPAIYDVNHSPALPAANEPVVVTARLSDPDGVSVVELQYRVDPGATLTTVTMRDDGTGGDALSNDSVYSATVTGPSGRLIAFRIQAHDAAPAPAATLFPPDAPARECLIRFGDPTYAGNLGVYRMWMTAANINTWSAREKLSNEALDGTFVANNFRVIYNAGARYRGSPFIRPGYSGPTSGSCGYVWTLPEDDLFLGEDELNLDSLEPQGRDSTALREVTAFTIMDQLNWPFSYQRFVHVVINGINNTARNVPIYTDSQQPNSSYIAAWFPDNPDGEIFKIDDWFEFNESGGNSEVARQGNKSASLQNFTTTSGIKKKARYRWSWEKKFNRTLNDDYSSLFAAVDALNAPDSVYVNRVESIIEIEEWLGALAFRHVVGDWDGYGYSRGKNQFCYRLLDGKFWMLQWDLDFALGCNGGHPPTQGLFDVALGGDGSSDHMPEVARLYNHPHFRRTYLRTLQRIANGPLQNANFMPVLDGRYRALQANNVATVSPYVGSGAQGISIPQWLERRRTNILTTIGSISNATFRISSPLDVTTASNVITISGTAPVLVKDIRLNGVAWGVTWTSVTGWTARVVLDTGTNRFEITGTDLNENTITTTQTVTGVYTGPQVSPAGQVIFTEIGYNPTVPRATFVEFFNKVDFTFDLSGWRVNGLDYTFPTPTILSSGQFIVIAEDSTAFATTYGTNAAVFDVFDGDLDPDGETLTLIKPGATSAEDEVIDQVRYENRLPWPAEAALSGATLQAIDGEQDNSRPSNWDAGLGWTRTSRSGNILSATNVLLWLQSAAGNAYLDDISLVGPDGVDIIENGGFETGGTEPWIVPNNYSTSVVTSDISHSGQYSFFLNATATGGGLMTSLQQWIGERVIRDTNYTLTFWSLPNTNSIQVNIRTLPGNNLSTNGLPRIVYGTPGAANVFADTQPAYDPIWLNELQPENTVSTMDNAGDREPWIELYNAGTATVNLQGYYLANNYDSNLTQWAFPAGASIAPGEYKIVWADGEPGESTATHLHTSFRLNSVTGSVALVRIVNSAPQVTDYLTYSGVLPNLSYGDSPDAQPFFRRIFQQVTPGAANAVSSSSVNVFINEWMAGNTNSLFDPADGNYDDWFELYNAGDEPIDLGAYYLTDTLDDPTQYQIPNNGQYVIPPGGFLLVWADNDSSQNSANHTDLHVNFALRLAGESIILLAPDGTTIIDSITFGSQTNDISQGRFADGSEAIFYMTIPTPRTPNTLGGDNSAPSISPISDKIVTVGQTLSFTATATDPDAGQTLAFSLQSGPAGASISAQGLFEWAPSAQTPDSNPVTIRVTDNGSPSQSATGSFTIFVRAPATINQTGNAVSLSFPSIAGQLYRIEYKNDLNEENWTELSTQTATGSQITINDNIGANPQRFYRLVQLD